MKALYPRLNALAMFWQLLCSPRSLIVGLCVSIGLVGCGGGSGIVNTPANTDIGQQNAKVWQIAKAMGPGINFGGMFEAPNEGEWGLTFQPAYLNAAWGAGFRTLRLPVRWSNHASASYPYAIDEVFMARIASVVDQALARGFHVVLNMHLYHDLDGDARDPNEFAVDLQVLEPRFIAMWEQIAVRFANRSDKLLFELYNEPHGRLDAQTWNRLLDTTLKQVRISNPARVVVLGGVSYNDAYQLGTLVLPNDPYLMATFHNYDPFTFTHQGAYWIAGDYPVGVTCCSAEQVEAIAVKTRHAAAWSSANGVPVFLGEFGAIKLADQASRVAYTRQVRSLAEAANMPWAYWEFGAANFGVYDTASQTFNTEMLSALVR